MVIPTMTTELSVKDERIMKNREVYQWAKKSVKAKSAFDFHITIYSALIIILAIINLSTTLEYLWFKWPLIAWSVVVFLYALRVIIFKNISLFKERMSQKGFSQ